MSVEIDVQIGKAGRVVIPVNVRRKYELHDGDWLRLILITDSDKEEKRKPVLKKQEERANHKNNVLLFKE